MGTTICECGLAKSYHEGSHDIATKPNHGRPPICSGYKPRKDGWWKDSRTKTAPKGQGDSMNLLSLVLLATMAAVAQGQNKPADITTLHCGKYQHEQKTPGHCANLCDPNTFACTTECLYVVATDECVDDLHVVTEAEWQSIMDRLTALESPMSCDPGKHWVEKSHDKGGSEWVCGSDMP